MHNPDLADNALADFELLMHAAARSILNHEDPAHFQRWFSESALLIAPDFLAPYRAEPDALRSLLVVLGREIWNRTPLPGNRFRPRTLPKPERNAPCPCGSGRKYKQCCALAEMSGSAFPELSMLEYVLDALPASQRTTLPYDYINPEELARVAEQWIEKGREKEAAKLLEGLLADWSKLDERAEFAFDKLLDCYDRLGNPVKKKRLLERGFDAPNKRLRAAAMQRQCCILSDRNEYNEAWRLFQNLQRLIPNDLSLSHLEITMLLGQGDNQRAAERAKFWVARLARDENAQGMLMDFLRSVAQGDTSGAMMSVAKETSPVLEQLLAMTQNLPAPACHYTLKPMDDSAGPLLPDNKLQALIAQWEVQGEFSEKLEDDIEWLQRNPLAWNCFDILDEWLEALEDARISHGFESAVLVPVLHHAESLLRLILKRYQADGLKLEWGWHENRPALRVMQRLVSMSRLTRNTAEAVRVAEWMVLTLNPNDNQGMREGLLHNYLHLNRIGDALVLAGKYPDDMAAMEYGEVLALVMDKQMAAAQKAIKTARKRYPEVAKMLLADKPKQPRLRDGLVQVGGKDEAWYYRQDYLDLWQTSGALSWLQNER